MLTATEITRRGLALAKHAWENREKCGQVAREVSEFIATGAKRCDATEHARRLANCQACKHWRPVHGTDLMHCAQCKCLAAKLWLLNPQWPETDCANRHA